jgi:hypothetical protein
MNPPSKYLSIKLSNKTKTSLPKRKAVAFLSDFQIIDSLVKLPIYLPFIPDQQDPRNQIAACIHRVGREMPGIDRDEKYVFKKYAEHFIKTKLTPLQDSDVPTTKEWLDNSPYNGKRKTHLAKLRNELDIMSMDLADNESFVKWEFYAEPKQPRGINSYSDESKVLLGPIQHAMDKNLFKLKYYVKGTTPKDWPAMMRDLFGNDAVMETDFSSFEAHHREVYAHLVAFWMNHMVGNLSEKDHYVRLIEKMVLGTNKMKFSTLTATVDQRLMSGALWTSSSNGLLNLLVLSYLNMRTMLPNANPEELVERLDEFFVGLVEGDDGICRFNNVDPTLIKKLGLELKFKKADYFGDASFCGIVCDPVELVVLTNPLKILRNFFVLPSKFAFTDRNTCLAMLRAKALSYKFNYNDNPIVGELCHRVCELTATHSVGCKMVTNELGSWYNNYVNTALEQKIWKTKPCVTQTSRLIIEKKFGISILEQHRIEEILRGGNGTFEMNLRHHMNQDDLRNALEYVSTLLEPALPVPASVPLIQEIMDTGRLNAAAKSKCSGVDSRFRNRPVSGLVFDDTV